MEILKKNIRYPLLLVVTLILIQLLWVGCNDMDDFEPERYPINTTETGRMYILSEGLFMLNNSTLACYDFETQSLESDFFLKQNSRGLGDTANDMVLYGSKIYIVVNVSSQIEVVDIHTGKSVKQIPMFAESGIARQPRYALAHEGYVYVTAFDGTLSRIDTLTLEIDRMTKCGRNPEGLCVANGKIYVANSGGLDFPNYDNTVSVISVETMQELKRIETAPNPYKVYADTQGDVYVSTRGNYADVPYLFQRIDSYVDTVVQTFDGLNVLNFTIKEDIAYLYNYDFATEKRWVKVFDCKTEKVLNHDFLKNSNNISTPYGIATNPYNDNIYIFDAYNFTVGGDMHCFDKNGILQYKLTNVGMNPNCVLFLP